VPTRDDASSPSRASAFSPGAKRWPIKTRTLILQGERDPFGSRSEVAAYKLAPKIRVHRLLDGDHSFRPSKASGRTELQNWEEAIDEIVAFLGLRQKHTKRKKTR
jgi:predicted alpha/beta-hydrolase family hydrolase